MEISSTPTTGTVRFAFSYDLSTQGRNLFQVMDTVAGVNINLGWYWLENSSNYIVWELPSDTVHDTGIPRTEGWHEGKIVIDGSTVEYYIDGALAYTDSTPVITGFTKIMLKSSTGAGGGGPTIGYFDDILITDCP